MIVLGCNFVFGQENPAGKTGKTDSTYIRSLLTKADNFASDGSWATAQEFALNALELAKSNKYSLLTHEAMLKLADISLRQRAYSKAITLAEQVLANDAKEVILAEAYGILLRAFHSMGNFDLAIEAGMKAKGIFLDLGLKNKAYGLYNILGRCYVRLKNFEMAKDAFSKEAAYYLERQDSRLQYATAIINLGDVYAHLKAYEQAVSYGHLALQTTLPYYSEKNNQVVSEKIITIYANLSEAHQGLGDLDSAYFYVKKCFDLSMLSDDFNQAYAYNDMGMVLLKMKQYDQALDHLNYGLMLAKTIPNTDVSEIVLKLYKNLSDVYQAKNNYERAHFFISSYIALKDSVFDQESTLKVAQMQALYDNERLLKQNEKLLFEQEIVDSTNFFRNIIIAVSILGLLMMGVFLLIIKRQHNKEKLGKQQVEKQNQAITDQKLALEKANKDIEILSQIGRQITNVLQVDRIVRTVYEQVNQLMDAPCLGIGVFNIEQGYLEFNGFIEKGEALPNFIIQLHEKTSLAVMSFSENKTIKIDDFTTEYASYLSDYTPVELGDEPVAIIYLPLLISGKPVGVITVQSFQKNAYSDKDLDILNTLAAYISVAVDNANVYKEIGNQNKHITDSIRYAKTIQEAVLPYRELSQFPLSGCELVFFPKDIVSGDFFWSAQVGDLMLFAVVDCTGHGVPGAFMSMIGTVLLNDIVNRLQILDPSEILTQFNEEIKTALHQNEDANNDSMDAVIVCLRQIDQQSFHVCYSGAKRPLIYVSDHQLHTVKGVNRSIGGRFKRNERPFVNHDLVLKKDDTLYLTSDGIIDQSDAENQKYGSERLYQLISQIHHLPAKDQQTIIGNSVRTHQGTSKQRDDITVLLLRL